MKTIAALGAVILLAGCKASQPAETVQQMMKDKVQPTAQVYWDAVRYISDETGEHEIVPRTDADWEKVRKAAADLQEYGKLLQTDAYTEGRNPDWTKFSQAMVEVSQQAEQAARDKSVDKVFEVSGTMYNVCSACHQVYPATVGPEASGTPASSPTTT
jgi:cytochrome c556